MRRQVINQNDKHKGEDKHRRCHAQVAEQVGQRTNFIQTCP